MKYVFYTGKEKAAIFDEIAACFCLLETGAIFTMKTFKKLSKSF